MACACSINESATCHILIHFGMCLWYYTIFMLCYSNCLTHKITWVCEILKSVLNFLWSVIDINNCLSAFIRLFHELMTECACECVCSLLQLQAYIVLLLLDFKCDIWKHNLFTWHCIKCWYAKIPTSLANSSVFKKIHGE